MKKPTEAETRAFLAAQAFGADELLSGTLISTTMCHRGGPFELVEGRVMEVTPLMFTWCHRDDGAVTGICFRSEEGDGWLRGWDHDDATLRAMLVAAALS